MKLLRFISQYSTDSEDENVEAVKSDFASFLRDNYKIASELHDPLLALTLSSQGADKTSAEFAVTRIQKHLRSFGVFGPGFAAVVPKWGGSAEITQVACRAGAVGGGIYVLNRGVQVYQDPDVDGDSSDGKQVSRKVVLSDGEEIKTKWIVGSRLDLPAPSTEPSGSLGLQIAARSISIVSSPLDHLFPQTAENGPVPAAVVVSIGGSALDSTSTSPVTLLIHSSETGECPNGQCKFYLPLYLLFIPQFMMIYLIKLIYIVCNNIEENISYLILPSCLIHNTVSVYHLNIGLTRHDRCDLW